MLSEVMDKLLKFESTSHVGHKSYVKDLQSLISIVSHGKTSHYSFLFFLVVI